MDFKGITWVGNVYQKFEAMCLEVEEVIYEDTVKYVENQVQTVGASVKKFCSDVMQDVLPPSSIDPVKVAAADLSLNPYGDFDIHKKPKANTKKDTVTRKKQISEDFNVKTESKENCTLDFSKQNRVIASDEKSRSVFKRKSRRENSMPSEDSKSSTPDGDFDRVSKFCEIDNDVDTVRIHMDKGSFSSRVENLDSVASSITLKADMISPSESVPVKESQLRDISSQGLPDDTSTEINGAGGNEGVDSLMGSYVSCDPKNSEFNCEDPVSPTGDCNVQFIESDEDMAEPWSETVQEFDKSNCVVVGREDLSVAAPVKIKPRSYKKKIQKAFSLKWLAREHEYKQLAVQHGCFNTKPSEDIAHSLSPKVASKEKSRPHPILESEWELL